MTTRPPRDETQTNHHYAEWAVTDRITNDRHRDYYPFIIQSITKPREIATDRDAWIRRGLIRACEATTTDVHNQYKNHPRSIPAIFSVVSISVPCMSASKNEHATTKTPRIRQLHGWVGIPHKFFARDDCGAIARTEIVMRDEKTPTPIQVPTPIALFHAHLVKELNTTNIWFSGKTEQEGEWGALNYAKGTKRDEIRLWQEVMLQPAYLFHAQEQVA